MILKLSIKNEIDSAIPDYHLGSERLRFNPLFSYRLSINGAELSDFISFCDFQNLSSGIDFCLASERRKVDFWVDGFFAWWDVGVFSEAVFFSSHKGEFWLSNFRRYFICLVVVISYHLVFQRLRLGYLLGIKFC